MVVEEEEVVVVVATAAATVLVPVEVFFRPKVDDEPAIRIKLISPIFDTRSNKQPKFRKVDQANETRYIVVIITGPE